MSLQLTDSIAQTFELLGQLSAEIAYIICPETFRLYRLAALYDSFLPEEPEKVPYEDENGLTKHVVLKKTLRKDDGEIIRHGTILGSEYFQTVLTGSFWAEFNKRISSMDPAPAIAAAAAVKTAMSKTRSEEKRKKEAKKMLTNFLKEKNLSIDDFDSFVAETKNIAEVDD